METSFTPSVNNNIVDLLPQPPDAASLAVPFYPPIVNQKIPNSLKEKGLDIEYGCRRLIDTLILNILEKFQAADNKESRKAFPPKDEFEESPFDQAWESFLCANAAVLDLTSSSEAQQKHKENATHSLQEARKALQGERKSHIPAPIVQLIGALSLLEGQLANLQGLKRPLGIDIEPKTFCSSIARCSLVINYLITKAPPALKDLGNHSKKIKKNLNDLYACSHKFQLQPAVDVHQGRQIAAQHDLFYSSSSDAITKMSEIATDPIQKRWLFMMVAVTNGMIDECNRFEHSHRAQEKKITATSIPIICDLLIQGISILANEIHKQGNAPKPQSEDGVLAQKYSKAHDAMQFELSNIVAHLLATLDQLKKEPIVTDEPAVVGVYEAEFYNFLINIEHEELGQLIGVYRAWQQKVGDEPRSEWGLWMMNITTIYQKGLEQLQKLLSDPLPSLQPKKTKKPSAKKKKARTKGISKGKQEENPPKAPVGPPTHFAALTPMVKGLEQLPIESPDFDSEFRAEWKIRSFTNLEGALRRLNKLQEGGLSFDTIWTTLHQLHTLLEAALDLALVHYPIGEATHVLGQKVANKPLHRHHNLQTLFEAFPDDSPLRPLITRYQSLMSSLAQANIMAVYPKWYQKHVAAKKPSALANLVLRVEKGEITPQLQTDLIQKWVGPAFLFVYELTLTLQGKPIAEEMPGLKWEGEPVAQLDPHPLPTEITSCQEKLSARLKPGDEALTHCQIYLQRMAERLSDREPSGSDLLTLLDLSHQVLRELYVAAISRQPEGLQLLQAKPEGKTRELRMEHDLSELQEALGDSSLAELPWPANAHYLLHYSFSLRKVDDIPREEEGRALFMDLKGLHTKGWNGDAELREKLMATYVIPSLQAAEKLLSNM